VSGWCFTCIVGRLGEGRHAKSRYSRRIVFESGIVSVMQRIWHGTPHTLERAPRLRVANRRGLEAIA